MVIKQVTEEGKFDYAIIGNNLGSGIMKAGAVSKDMRAGKACIVWNTYFPGDEEPYIELGFKHFLSRRDLGDHLGKYLRAKHFGQE
jgi:hypothetical protein